MAETTKAGSQKITTHYDDKEPAATSEAREHHSERRESNRKLRNMATGAPVGNSATRQYDDAPMQGKEKEGIFKKISKTFAPDLSNKSKSAGKQGIAKPVGRAITNGVVNTGARVGSLVGQPSMPVWLQDQRKSGSKSTRISGAELPGWIYGGGMPWDQPRQSSTVERVIVTRIHADGSRTRTERHPQQNRRQQSSRPDWIKF